MGDYYKYRPGSAHEMFQGMTVPEDALEFALAMDRYRIERRRRYPTCGEVIAVLKSLGYRKVAPVEPLPKF